MAFQVIWTASAAEDLREIVLYITQDKPSAARSLAEKMIAKIEAGAEFPKSHRKIPEKDDDSYREIILRPYRIILRIDESRKRMYVIRIWHAARGIPDI